MTDASYTWYISSSKWTDRRSRYFSTHDKKCRFCGTLEKIHLHHLSYDCLGNEPDRDLMPLCLTCHKMIHKYIKMNALSIKQGTWECINWNDIPITPQARKAKLRKKTKNLKARRKKNRYTPPVQKSFSKLQIQTLKETFSDIPLIESRTKRKYNSKVS